MLFGYCYGLSRKSEQKSYKGTRPAPTSLIRGRFFSSGLITGVLKVISARQGLEVTFYLFHLCKKNDAGESEKKGWRDFSKRMQQHVTFEFLPSVSSGLNA